MLNNEFPNRVKLFSSFKDCAKSKFYFSGVAFEEKNVYLGTSDREIPFNNIDNLEQGRFFVAYEKDEKKIFKTDNTGQELVFYYTGTDGWAISNSFKVLAEHLHSHGVQLTINYASLMTFQGKHSFCEALTTDDTTIKEIFLLGNDEQIEVLHETEFQITKKPESVVEPQDLLSLATLYVSQWKQWLKALVDDLPEGSVVCDLTGGVDSRLVLALLIASGCDLRRVEFVSNPLAHEDYRIATELASHYGLSLNKERKKTPDQLTSEEKLELSLTSSLGVYHGFYVPSIRDTSTTSIHFHGGGGGLFRSVYNPAMETVLLSQKDYYPDLTFLARSIRQLIKFDRKKVEPFAQLPEDRSIRYFFETRNKYHFGRQWFKSLESQLITPLISRKLLEMKTISQGMLADRELYLLIFLLTEPNLISFSFDKPEKSFSAESIEKIGKIISSTPITINTTSPKSSLHLLQEPLKNSKKQTKPLKNPIPAQQLLLERAEAAWKKIPKNIISKQTKKDIETNFRTKELNKQACRLYLFIALIEFLTKVTIKSDIKKEIHKNELALEWNKKTIKRSPTILNSLHQKKIEAIKNDSGLLIAQFREKEWIIKQNILSNGRKKQPLFNDKDETKRKINDFTKTPKGKVFKKENINEAEEFLKQLTTKIGVVKPLAGVGGQGITTNIKNRQELEKATQLVEEENFILEEFIPGVDCRLYVVGGAVVAAALRTPPIIIGDGTHTVAELIALKRAERKEKPYFQKHEIAVSEKTYEKFNENTVLPEGQTVYLNDTGNISRGGESHDITDIIHPSFQKIAAGCWIAYGCTPDHFAIDLICEDVEIDINKQHYAVLELNAKPGHGQHVYPYTGKSRRLSDKIVDYWFN